MDTQAYDLEVGLNENANKRLGAELVLLPISGWNIEKIERTKSGWKIYYH